MQTKHSHRNRSESDAFILIRCAAVTACERRNIETQLRRHSSIVLLAAVALLTSWKPAIGASDPVTKTVVASDGTFSVQVPVGWSVRRAGLYEGLLLWGPHGESLSFYCLTIPADQPSWNLWFQGKKLLQEIQGQPMTRDQVAILSRAISRPLTPTQVIQEFFPRLAAPTIKKMRVVEHRPLPQAQLVFFQGAHGEEVHYEFTLHAKQGNSWLRQNTNPPLLALGAVAMEGRAKVVTRPGLVIPGFNVPGLNNWTISFEGYEAPKDLFQKDEALYAKILGSVKLDLVAIQKRVKAETDAVNNLTQAIIDSSRQIQEAVRRMQESQAEAVRRFNEALAMPSIRPTK
jgi:hypothetical protein